MHSARGFSLRKHIFRLTKCVSDRSGHGNFCCVPRKLLNFLKIDPKLMSTGLKSGYVSLTDDEGQPGAVAVPKGLMAVYIGKEDGGGGELRRVLVPVVYFNHPLFGELLREAEEEYGFCQQGGITIPCGLSEFEHVKTRVAAISRCGSGPRRRKALLCGLFMNWSKLEDGME